MDRQICVVVLHMNILLCSTMLLCCCMFLLMHVKFLKMLIMYSNNTRSLTCKVLYKSLFSRVLFIHFRLSSLSLIKCLITISNVPQFWKIFTLIKLKKLEKYCVLYQEKIMLPKQVKEMVLIYQLKETRKEQAFVFSVLFHNVCNHKVLSSYRKKNDPAIWWCCLLCTEAEKCHSNVGVDPCPSNSF